MNRVLKGIGLLLVVIALGVAIGLLSSSNKNKAPVQKQVTTAQAQPDVTPAEPAPAAVPKVFPKSDTAPVAPTPAPLVPNPTTSPTVLTNWEEKLDEILGADGDEAAKARQMAELLPKLPQEGQVEVAQHLSNLVSDEDYGLISGFLTNSSFPEEVLDVLIADSLNRPNAVKLPLLLDVARDSNNPKAPEAREILELFLEEDYGNDWAKWQSKLQEWIVNNPD